MTMGSKSFLREFARIFLLVAIAGPISAIIIAYARTGAILGPVKAIDFSWSRFAGLIVICAIVAALPSRRTSK